MKHIDYDEDYERSWGPKKDEPTYIVTKDLQGETFTIGFNGTAEEFKNKFKRYILNSPECTAKLESLQGEDIINYIAEIFQLEIKKED